MPEQPAPSAAALAVARDVFGLKALRSGQAEVVAAAEAGSDVLFVAPTGAGKSIAYWVPALAGTGLTLVVSPLIALMTDQVGRLRRAGVAAAAVHSQLEPGDYRETMAAARGGRLRFLYVAPERFASPGFEEVLPELGVGRLVVDEAHCISSWGHDFRQDYRRLGAAVIACGRPPVTAVTATATPRTRDDITASLGLRRPLTVVTGFVRPELTLEVWRRRRGAEKQTAISHALAEMPGRALVYCGRTRDCDETAEALRTRGIAAAAYHGGLEGLERSRVQAAFTEGPLRVVVATSAFGMGVDIADIRQVIHHDLPGSIEAYYQEAGRAGRDGLPARCVLLYHPADRDLQEFFIEQAYPERELVRQVYRAVLHAGRWSAGEAASLVPGLDRRAVEAALRLLEGAGALLPGGAVARLTRPPVDFEERRRLKDAAQARLTQMIAYSSCRDCRHARIADYFGEAGAPRSCSSCDNCRGLGAARVAVPEAAARSALRAVAKFDSRLGAARVAAVLRGAESVWSRERPWVRQLDFFGALSSWGESAVRELVDALVERDLVRRGHGERPTLSVSPEGRAALGSGSEIGLQMAGLPATGTGRVADRAGRRIAVGPGEPAVQARFDRLRQWRLGEARIQGKPAYTVFSDRTLRAIAERQPRLAGELLQVSGVGRAKAERYGAALLATLRAEQRPL